MDSNYISKLLNMVLNDDDIKNYSTRDVLNYLIGYCRDDFSEFSRLLCAIVSKDIKK